VNSMVKKTQDKRIRRKLGMKLNGACMAIIKKRNNGSLPWRCTRAALYGCDYCKYHASRLKRMDI
jgi:hypothetical protein